MKSKFFGINAKLALALLAVSGTMFTSCYESEKDDVTLPYNPPAALYTVVGTVTDVVTGKVIDGATVAFSGADSKTLTTVAGAYTFTTEKAGAYTIAVSKDGYTASSGSLTVTALKAGQAATYQFNAVLQSESFQIEGLTMTVSTTEKNPSTVTFDATEDEEVDYVNDSANFIDLTFNFNVNVGAGLLTDELGVTTRAALDGLKEYISTYLAALYGGAPAAIDAVFATEDKEYKFELAPYSSVKTVFSTTKYKEDTHIIKYNGVTYKIVVVVAYAWEFGSTQFSNNIYHGHGLGHGHSGNLNAGGGSASGI
ncbi:carboxypeptidase-like regulatory domain-containing protein [Bacteroides sp. 214]|uniref:carboxypeptidase-like regulatory domain-containing protein n=1 Tax=Bacteroides sp. 214 TaxID=2302935 RepID=UPI0013D21AB4|nr:carboxypeptidase-like regulatory domain-containing protein [Bacteroides sp. 214]